MEFIRTYKPYLIFSGLIIIGLFIFALISQGFYPIATVNGKIITAHAFWQKYQTQSAYFQNFSEKIMAGLGEDTPPPTANDFKSQALTELIENILIKAGAEKELGSDLDVLMATKLEKVPDDEDFKKAIASVYGANLSDFRDDFMVPIAREEILSGRLFLKGEDFNDWLLKAKTEAKVKIFSDEFTWDGVEVQISN